MFDLYLSAPDVGELEQEYVLRAMQSGWIAPVGPELTAFEEEVAARAGRAYGVALSSGTAALHLALVAWGVGPGDVVPVSTLTFAATANAVTYVGATPYFVDVDPTTGNLSPELLAEALATLDQAGARVPAIIPVDVLGKVADYEAFSDVIAGRNIKVLSDAAEAFGASRGGRPAGSFGDAAIVSFNGNKILTTSGGGMFLTDDRKIAERVRKLATQAREPVPHYEHAEVGYNYRLSNLLAALGRAQLARFDGMLKRRREIREAYRDFFSRWSDTWLLGGTDDSEDNCWLTAVVLGDGAPARSGDLAAALTGARIESRPIWKPMHAQPAFAACASTLDGSADALFASGLTLPSGSSLTNEDLGRVFEALRRAI